MANRYRAACELALVGNGSASRNGSKHKIIREATSLSRNDSEVFQRVYILIIRGGYVVFPRAQPAALDTELRCLPSQVVTSCVKPTNIEQHPSAGTDASDGAQ